MNILVVEDDLVTRRLLKKTIEGWGHEVLTAESGEEAWDILMHNQLKFVIADWIMPGIDGIALCRKIRSEIPGYIYFILLTGKDRKEDMIDGLNAGADDYVTKPFDRNELKVRVKAGERILNLEKELNEKNEKLSRLNARLEELARLDHLMGIGNRRSFYETIEKVHFRACRYAHGYGLIMCDIDYFKSYNDTYGHLQGDTVLRTVADSLQKSTRRSDEIFRFGGEEIVVVLPEQTLEETVGVAEKIKKGIESLGIEHRGSSAGILTISCGVAAFDMSKRNNKWEDILELADKALYSAKSKGRNQVCAG